MRLSDDVNFENGYARERPAIKRLVKLDNPVRPNDGLGHRSDADNRSGGDNLTAAKLELNLISLFSVHVQNMAGT
jgi:hypothetical protein